MYSLENERLIIYNICKRAIYGQKVSLIVTKPMKCHDIPVYLCQTCRAVFQKQV